MELRPGADIIKKPVKTKPGLRENHPGGLGEANLYE
jgi:hypothetical protein